PADPMHADQVARDDAHLRSLGIKPELRRTLGFLSNFAVAFSYISVSTGTFTNQAVAFGVGGPAVFWAWPLVILGQTFVALNFAELSSHFPVAGSIYQWSKRLSHKTLGWFAGWIYFWAGVVTVTAVAATVPLVLSTIQGWDLASPSPLGFLNMWQFVGLLTLLITTLINIEGVRLLALLNNIGVAAEILGMVVFALILLFFANHQSPSVLFDTSYTKDLAGGNYFALYLVMILVAVFVCTLAIQGATTRLMFSMGRDRRLPFGAAWGSVNSTFKTPANAAIAVGVLGALPLIVMGATASIYLAIAATGMIYLSYILCNFGVLIARSKGWPHRGAWFSLGSWGTIINILALVWGSAMVINIGIWTSPIFGDFGNDLRNLWSNPFINTFLAFGTNSEGKPNILSGLPAWPVFETLVGLVVIVGLVYYLVAQRGREDRVEADIATGE